LWYFGGGGCRNISSNRSKIWGFAWEFLLPPPKTPTCFLSAPNDDKGYDPDMQLLFHPLRMSGTKYIFLSQETANG